MIKVKNISLFDLYDQDLALVFNNSHLDFNGSSLLNEHGYVDIHLLDDLFYFYNYDEYEDYGNYDIDVNGFCIPYLSLRERRNNSLDILLGIKPHLGRSTIGDFWP